MKIRTTAMGVVLGTLSLALFATHPFKRRPTLCPRVLPRKLTIRAPFS